MKKLSTTLKIKKIGVSHAWARQNDNTRQLQVGCAASRHHLVSEVYTEQKFQGFPCPYPNAGQQQFVDGTTWPCLTHKLRPTRSLRSRSGNVMYLDDQFHQPPFIQSTMDFLTERFLVKITDNKILRLTAWIWVLLKRHE